MMTEPSTSAEARAGERRYERWEAANGRSERRRRTYEKVAVTVLALAAGVWVAVQTLL
jgi:hypothetical protein